MFEELIRAWDGEEVVIRYDPPTSTWMFVGVHSTVLGPGMGGTRMKVYAVPADGLRDVLRLSGAMIPLTKPPRQSTLTLGFLDQPISTLMPGPSAPVRQSTIWL